MFSNGHRPGGLAAVLVCLGAAPAFAGGYDTGERDWDFLFQHKPVAFEAAARAIYPDRRIENVFGALGPSVSASEAAPFSIERYSVTHAVSDALRCMASYRRPFAGYADYGPDWTYAFSAISQDFSSNDYGLTCAAGVASGKGLLSVVGGYSMQQIEYQLVQNGGLAGIVTTRVDDWSPGWRAGLAYEIAEYALRASVIYNSQVDYDMTGTWTAANVPGQTGVFGSISMPQSVEAKFQSGVAPGTLAFASVKWTDWSVAQNMPICAIGTPVCTQAAAISGLTLLFQDSWTVTGGLARQLTDWLSVVASLTWDQGATQGFTSQTDTVSAGLNVVVTGERAELMLGGTAGVMEGGSLSTMTLADGSPNPVGYAATFGDDFVYSLSASFKYRF